MWGYLKNNVFATQPARNAELKERITKKINVQGVNISTEPTESKRKFVQRELHYNSMNSTELYNFDFFWWFIFSEKLKLCCVFPANKILRFASTVTRIFETYQNINRCAHTNNFIIFSKSWTLLRSYTQILDRDSNFE